MKTQPFQQQDEQKGSNPSEEVLQRFLSRTVMMYNKDTTLTDRSVEPSNFPFSKNSRLNRQDINCPTSPFFPIGGVSDVGFRTSKMNSSHLRMKSSSNYKGDTNEEEDGKRSSLFHRLDSKKFSSTFPAMGNKLKSTHDGGRNSEVSLNLNSKTSIQHTNSSQKEKLIFLLEVASDPSFSSTAGSFSSSLLSPSTRYTNENDKHSNQNLTSLSHSSHNDEKKGQSCSVTISNSGTKNHLRHPDQNNSDQDEDDDDFEDDNSNNSVENEENKTEEEIEVGKKQRRIEYCLRALGRNKRESERQIRNAVLEAKSKRSKAILSSLLQPTKKVQRTTVSTVAKKTNEYPRDVSAPVPPVASTSSITRRVSNEQDDHHRHHVRHPPTPSLPQVKEEEEYVSRSSDNASIIVENEPSPKVVLEDDCDDDATAITSNVRSQQASHIKKRKYEGTHLSAGAGSKKQRGYEGRARSACLGSYGSPSTSSSNNNFNMVASQYSSCSSTPVSNNSNDLLSCAIERVRKRMEIANMATLQSSSSLSLATSSMFHPGVGSSSGSTASAFPLAGMLSRRSHATSQLLTSAMTAANDAPKAIQTGRQQQQQQQVSSSSSSIIADSGLFSSPIRNSKTLFGVAAAAKRNYLLSKMMTDHHNQSPHPIHLHVTGGGENTVPKVTNTYPSLANPKSAARAGGASSNFYKDQRVSDVPYLCNNNQLDMIGSRLSTGLAEKKKRDSPKISPSLSFNDNLNNKVNAQGDDETARSYLYRIRNNLMGVGASPKKIKARLASDVPRSVAGSAA